jgi:hypothetical protein
LITKTTREICYYTLKVTGENSIELQMEKSFMLANPGWNFMRFDREDNQIYLITQINSIIILDTEIDEVSEEVEILRFHPERSPKEVFARTNLVQNGACTYGISQDVMYMGYCDYED